MALAGAGMKKYQRGGREEIKEKTEQRDWVKGKRLKCVHFCSIFGHFLSLLIPLVYTILIIFKLIK